MAVPPPSILETPRNAPDLGTTPSSSDQVLLVETRQMKERESSQGSLAAPWGSALLSVIE